MIQSFTAKKQMLILDDFMEEKNVLFCFFFYPCLSLPPGLSHNIYHAGFNPVFFYDLFTFFFRGPGDRPLNPGAH